MSELLCKYCSVSENKQERPGLICERCTCFVHLACLRRQGTPGDFKNDVFFDFTCADCTLDSKEVFKRPKFAWVNVIILTLHHLDSHSQGISNKGFFHYKTHISSFIDRSWLLLFGPYFKQKKNWIGTIAGILSVYNHMFFQSGSVVLGETGWWRLLHNFSPAVAAHIVQEISRDPHKNRVKNCLADKHTFIERINKMGYKDLLTETVMNTPVPCKKRRINSDELSTVSSSSFTDHLVSDSRIDFNEGPVQEVTFEESILGLGAGEGSFSDAETVFRGFDFEPTGLIPAMRSQSDTSSTHSYQPHGAPYDSDSREEDDEKTDDTGTKVTRENFFSAELNSVDLPWVEEVKVENKEDLIEMTQYEEVQLLKHVEGLTTKIKDPSKRAYLCRLKAKLTLRRLKRHKQLPIFDLDKAVKILGGYVTEDPRTVVNAERILDRFQRSYLMDNLSGTISSTNYGTVLLSSFEPAPFRSPYSSTFLKPYIRREKCTPLWLRVTDELLVKTNKHIEGYKPPPHATLDYSYVRPQHIAAVNNLCAQFFWPGVDLTEALEYPEFSCVVTYKKLVVGCAFLVPDAGHNHAYISFILTRPEWRRASIATFMLYHLLQTCTGKDVTLHVSPTNPAIFLYQKFGFKVEELVQDFYEKYYDIDYKGCRHALFLRLVR